jgi:hypothetical protein
MNNKLSRNADVLRDQFDNAADAIELDIMNAKRKWGQGDRLGALHTYIFGPPAELFEHMHRWAFYLFGLYVVTTVGRYVVSLGLF